MYTTVTYYKGKPFDEIKNLQVHVFTEEIFAVEDVGLSLNDLETTKTYQQIRANNTENIICIKILGISATDSAIIVSENQKDFFKKHFEK